MDVCVKLTVKGRVQGVGFRWFVQKTANKVNVNGYVKNLFNGDVEIEAEGARGRVEELIKEVKAGPRFAHVTDVFVEWKEYEGKYDSFDVKF
ncbi:acylphosphatase [candidate division KSB1 bacterium]|nr:acylphosphatase [candidate division KSB1 bacterium]NIR68700.1 acylphosphatase [candidate division KSB1 bacterium]NIS25517.1 acylphosphatase [candidate division KSB1 bacterium]NIT72410.1 acylphosphatase [candidate division KSB1 bacterium]NIU26194.1 acylphosphatase [candidate division KSB1 bacterium]